MKPQSGRNIKKTVCVCVLSTVFFLDLLQQFFPTFYHCDFILWWHRNQGETLEEMCVCSFHGLYFNGGRAHHIIESKVQWKPFCRATQQYSQDDWLGGKFPYTMTYAHGPHLIYCNSIFLSFAIIGGGFIRGSSDETAMGLVRITSWYPNFNGSHFGLPPSEIHRMTGLPPKIVWTMTYSHRPHQGETLEKKLCLYVGLCLSVYLCLCFCYSVGVWLCEWVFGMFSNGSGAHYSLILVTPFAVVVKKKKLASLVALHTCWTVTVAECADLLQNHLQFILSLSLTF